MYDCDECTSRYKNIQINSFQLSDEFVKSEFRTIGMQSWMKKKNQDVHEKRDGNVESQQKTKKQIEMK